MFKSIIQIVPGATPLVNGVGDFALTVARVLRSIWGIDSIFVVCSPAWSGPENLDGFRFIPMRSRRSNDLYDALCSAAKADSSLVFALLQLSPYGFNINGAPFWVLKGLRRWKKANPAKHRLLTYFHELYAMSMPWRRAFWVSPLQRKCSREIAWISDVALTSTEHYARILARWYGRNVRSINRIPVVSNVGEPAEIMHLRQRSRRLVIWGSAVGKREIYTRHFKTVEAAVRSIGIEEVSDVGQTWNGCPRHIQGVPIKMRGILSPDRLSEVLAGSLLAAFSYDPNYLAKSTMFAAFCAHGVPALCLPTKRVEPEAWDGIHHGVHFITSAPTGSGDVMVKLDQIAGQAHDWYSSHSSTMHAQVIAQQVLADESHFS